jgi:uncharacterized protein (DUF2147 family)
MPSGLLMRFSRSSLNAMLAGGAMALAVATGAVAAEPSAVGLWQKTEDGKPVVWVLIVDRNGVFEGAFAKMFPKPGEKTDYACNKCEDDRKDKPLLGLSFIRDMKRKSGSALEYEGGNILDPRDGAIYHALMSVSEDGQTLHLRGYLGIPMFGKTEDWTRVPDKEIATLDPAVLSQYMPQLAQRAGAATRTVAPAAKPKPAPAPAPKQ